MDYLKQGGKTGKNIFSSASKMTSRMGTTGLKTMGSMGKAVTGAVTSLPNLSSETNRSDSNSKRQIAEVLSLLGEIRLQSPTKHSGLVIAYSAATLAPLDNPGLKFRFYKMSNVSSEEQFVQVDESQRAWYAPTLDDIGSKICIQCEDNFDQGFTRYLESTVIESDDTLANSVESALQKQFYEIKDTGVTLGTDLKPFADRSIAGDLSSAYIRSRPTVLSSTGPDPFMQLEGLSYIEVDSNGIFVSLPVPPAPDNAESSDEPMSMNSISMRSSAASNRKPLRRGLLIASSDAITVECTQPVSLVITVPITRENPDGTPYIPTEDECNDATGTHQKSDIDDGIHTDKSSPRPSIGPEPHVVLPWTYIRILNSQGIRSDLTAEEIEDEEREASSFASIITSLEEFVQRVPLHKQEIRLCISCGDRAERDALVCMIRALVVGNLLQPEERLDLFPWRQRKVKKTDACDDDASNSEEGDGRGNGHEHQAEKYNQKINELMERIKELELETDTIRTMQGRMTGDATNCTGKSGEMSGQSSVSPSHPVSAAANEEIAKMLSSKVLDLESTLADCVQRENQAVKEKQAIEQKNMVIATDLAMNKKTLTMMEGKLNDTLAQLATQGEVSESLRKDLDNETDNMSKAHVLIKELEELRPVSAERKIEIEALSQELDVRCSELDTLRPLGTMILQYLPLCMCECVCVFVFQFDIHLHVSFLNMFENINMYQYSFVQTLEVKQRNEIITLKKQLEECVYETRSKVDELFAQLMKSKEEHGAVLQTIQVLYVASVYHISCEFLCMC